MCIYIHNVCLFRKLFHTRRRQVSISIVQEKRNYQILCIHFKGLKCRKSPDSKNFSVEEMMSFKIGKTINFAVKIRSKEMEL